MYLTVFYGCWLSITVSLVLWSCWLCLTVLCVTGCLSQSLLVPWSCCKSLTVSILFLALSHSLFGSMELLHVSHCLFRFHGVAACLSLSPIVAVCLSEFHGVAACLSLSLMVAVCLSGPMWVLHIFHCISSLLAVFHSLS